jgi:hypothetical protein
MKNDRLIYNYCIYNKDRFCYKEADQKCDKKYCSLDPTRFDNRKITKGQIIYLVSKGMDKEKVESLSYLEAADIIREFKIKNKEGICIY